MSIITMKVITIAIPIIKYKGTIVFGSLHVQHRQFIWLLRGSISVNFAIDRERFISAMLTK